MDKARVYGALGLARRAGKCLAGDFAVERALKAGKVKLVVLDATVSEATRARYAGMCERMQAGCIELADMGRAIGKHGNKIAAIVDDNFAGMIMAAMQAPDPA